MCSFKQTQCSQNHSVLVICKTGVSEDKEMGIEEPRKTLREDI